jgi:hypothetical protein
MTRPKNIEDRAYQAVLDGELECDAEGRIWRLAARRWNRWLGKTIAYPCERRRAESLSTVYLQVHVMWERKSSHALAHRLIWRHFNGSIPSFLTINHKNGIKTDNHPDNLELATYSEQALHSINILGNRPKGAPPLLLEFEGVTLPLRMLSERFGLKSDTVLARLKRGWSVADALKRPLVVKGYATDTWKTKRDELEHSLGITIETA